MRYSNGIMMGSQRGHPRYLKKWVKINEERRKNMK
jgi:hypothetical protein